MRDDPESRTAVKILDLPPGIRSYQTRDATLPENLNLTSEMRRTDPRPQIVSYIDSQTTQSSKAMSTKGANRIFRAPIHDKFSDSGYSSAHFMQGQEEQEKELPDTS